MRGHWYVLQSKPKKEKLVCAQLQKFSQDTFEVFFPRLRNHLGIRPLFPSYLFIHALLQDVENYRLIKYTRGVLRVIGNREEGPLPVSEEIINTIRRRTDPNGLVDQRYIFPMGKQVRVRKGPLKDLIGILEKPVPETKRVQILFKLLKYPLRAVLKFEDLEIV